MGITPQKVEAVIKKIVEISNPLKVILFGSYVRQSTHLNSDLDVIVVTKEDIQHPRKESVRIRRALKGVSMPMDILVVSGSKFAEMAEIPGLIYMEAVKNGKVVYESTG